MIDFSRVGSSFRTNPYYDGRLNGVDLAIMESQQNADRLISCFEQAIRAGYNPNDVANRIYKETGIMPEDLTAFDRKRVERKVEEVYKSGGTKNGKSYR